MNRWPLNYYKTAVKLSWLCVGGLLSAFALVRGAYQLIPFYLFFVVLAGTVPALICAWALKVFARSSKRNGEFIWMLRGAWLGWFYVIASDFIMRVIGPTSLGSMKGLLCLVMFGPSVLLQNKVYGLVIIIFTGLVNGAVLNILWRRRLD